MEELSLAHILNAEAEKIQFALGTLETAGGQASSMDDILETNKLSSKMVRNVIKNQMLLSMKMEDTVDLAGATQPVTPAPVEPTPEPAAPVTEPVAPVTEPVAPVTEPIAQRQKPVDGTPSTGFFSFVWAVPAKAIPLWLPTECRIGPVTPGPGV